MNKLIIAAWLVLLSTVAFAQSSPTPVVSYGGSGGNGGSGISTLTAGTGITLSSGATCTSSCTINASGSGTPGGSATQLQYNNAGAFGGVTGVTSNGTILTFGDGALAISGLTSGTSILKAPATGGGTATLFTGSDTIVGLTATQTLTNKTATTPAASDNSTKVATTAYVTTGIANAIAAGNPAVAVQASTTVAGDTSTYTYNNGASGIGATLTGVANTALTVDGYTFTAVGQRLLVKNDTQSPSGAFNGIYSVTQVQTGILPVILTRAADYNQPSDINNTGAIPIINGTVNGTTQWVITSTVNTVGTDPATFAKFSSNPSTLLSNTLTNAHLFVGNGSNIATDVAMSGSCTMANTGAVTCSGGTSAFTSAMNSSTASQFGGL